MKKTYLYFVAIITAVISIYAFEMFDSKTISEPTISSIPSTDLESQLDKCFVSREPLRAYVPSSRPLEGMTIIIDPGHGGPSIPLPGFSTTGASGRVTKQKEKDVNLRVALLLRFYLQEAGGSVYMTRVHDSFAKGMCHGMNGIQERCERAKLANKNKADIFISVHHDDINYNKNINRSTVFYSNNNSSIALAENIVNSVSYCLGTGNGGAKPNPNLTVLSRLTVPGVLVECSFMSNPDEDKRLNNLAYNKLEAKSIAIGVLNYAHYHRGRNVDFASLFQPIDSHWQHTVNAANRTLSTNTYDRYKTKTVASNASSSKKVSSSSKSVKAKSKTSSTAKSSKSVASKSNSSVKKKSSSSSSKSIKTTKKS